MKLGEGEAEKSLKVKIKRKIRKIYRFFINFILIFLIILFILILVFIYLRKWELAIALFAASFISCLVIYSNDQERMIQIIMDCYREIKDLEKEYYEKYEKEKNDEEKAWRSLFLNTLEFYAFLFNRDYFPREEFLDFFREVIIFGYSEILPEEQKKRKIVVNFLS